MSVWYKVQVKQEGGWIDYKECEGKVFRTCGTVEDIFDYYQQVRGARHGFFRIVETNFCGEINGSVIHGPQA